MDDVTDIAAFYNNRPQKESLRLDQHQLEFDLSWRYLMAHMPENASILEIGAAAGRYTVPLARRGHSVVAVDISTALLDVCRDNLTAAGLADRVRLITADARDLAAVEDDHFDAVLMMGPLYHLVEAADRTLALQQAYERLHRGGILFTSFISRLGNMGGLLKHQPDWIEQTAQVAALLERGDWPASPPHSRFRGYFATASEIAPLHEAIGFETLAVAGIEPVISADDESYNRLEGKQRQLWLDLFYKISTDSSIIGASRHLLYVGRKPPI